jgi:hypothetical protein
MLWIGVCEVVCVALLGGCFGGALMALAHKQSNKFNMSMMEQYWKSDIEYLKAHIDALNSKLSTFSVAKPVNNGQKHSNNKGYNHKRRFNQGA